MRKGAGPERHAKIRILFAEGVAGDVPLRCNSIYNQLNMKRTIYQSPAISVVEIFAEASFCQSKDVHPNVFGFSSSEAFGLLEEED